VNQDRKGNRVPPACRAGQRADLKAVLRFGVVRSLACYFDQRGLLADWYWPEGTHGKVWNWFHGNGWRTG
jgi:hypothetical protein